VHREGKDVLAERDHVAVAEAAVPVHGLAVEEGAVLAAEVVQEEVGLLLQDLRVVPGEPLVGEEDVAVARAADGDALLDEGKTFAGAVAGVDGDLGHGSGGGDSMPASRAVPRAPSPLPRSVAGGGGDGPAALHREV